MGWRAGSQVLRFVSELYIHRSNLTTVVLSTGFCNFTRMWFILGTQLVANEQAPEAGHRSDSLHLGSHLVILVDMLALSLPGADTATLRSRTSPKRSARKDSPFCRMSSSARPSRRSGTSWFPNCIPQRTLRTGWL